jgi:two-component system sensor histidine kinase PilS (NtrC family)
MTIPHSRKTLIPQWKPLRLFNFYRAIIGLLLLTFGIMKGPISSGQTIHPLFTWLAGAYLLFALFWIIPNYYRWPSYHIQVYIQSIVDILFITLAMHFSGGMAGGLGMLMIAAIAGASLLIPGNTAILFATVAVFALFFEQIYTDLYQSFRTTSYSQAGLLGASLLATAILAMYLARRAEQSEELAEKRGIDLENLAKLNEYIVNRMSSGIIVVDDDARIRLINQSACALLGQPSAKNSKPLHEASEPLYRLFTQWKEKQIQERSAQLVDQSSITGLQVRISPIGARKEDRGTMIFIQDTADINRQIQATKLVSLGRLTASIAHEIRNPLGAISHAEQLLAESQNLDKSDRRMVHIIHDNSRRMNEIIQNILQLSRKELPKQEVIFLKQWIEDFIIEFGRIQGIDHDWASITFDPEDTQVYVDQNHLHQIVWNLFTNVEKYGVPKGRPFRVILKGGISPDSSAPFLDVIDFGPGIETSVQAQLFEPFFTTSNTGTGLGLYISRELLKNNGGNLSYISDSPMGSCFRIQFPIHQVEANNIATSIDRR